MKCAADSCNDPQKGLRYVADGVHVCTHCGEMTRNHRHVQLAEFIEIDPVWQKQIGLMRQAICEAAGHWDWLKDQGVEIDRAR